VTVDLLDDPKTMIKVASLKIWEKNGGEYELV
jgi:hypothetical protein